MTKIKFIKENGSVISEMKVGNDLTPSDEKKLTSFDGMEVIEHKIKFKPGLKVKDTHSYDNLGPDDIIEMIIKVK